MAEHNQAKATLAPRSRDRINTSSGVHLSTEYLTPGPDLTLNNRQSLAQQWLNLHVFFLWNILDWSTPLTSKFPDHLHSGIPELKVAFHSKRSNARFILANCLEDLTSLKDVKYFSKTLRKLATFSQQVTISVGHNNLLGTLLRLVQYLRRRWQIHLWL